MKKIDEYGNPYIFSTDKGIELTCVAIVDCLKYIDVKPTSEITKYKLAAEYYAEHAPDDAMIFKRKPDLSDTDSDETTDVDTWLDFCVDIITKSFGYKEKVLNVYLKEGRENKGRVGYKMGSDGCMYTYTLSTPFRYLKISPEDFKKILDEHEMTFDELHWQYYNQIISDIRIKMVQFKKIYPSLEWVAEENPYNNSNKKEEIKFTKRNFSNRKEKKDNNTNDTMDVFDGID